MQLVNVPGILVENRSLLSVFLGREVKVDFYLPKNMAGISEISLLLINDGQNMKEMGLAAILENLYTEKAISALLCVAIHAGPYRSMEYGVASQTDYHSRGAKAGYYTSFVLRELLPFIRDSYKIAAFKERAFAGFSLGGLCALDMVWNHPLEFNKVGIFSGSLWWRDKDQDDDDFDENVNRIMHRQIKEEKNNYPWLKFFFEVGTLDETADRNNNGVIDSIDDTIGLIDILVGKGYKEDEHIRFVQLKDGRHDVPTWAKAFPDFLKWGWGEKRVLSRES